MIAPRPARRRRALRLLLAASLVAATAALALLEARGARPLPAGSFRLSHAGGRAVVWAVGDAASGTTAAIRLAREIRRARPDLLIYLGDVYPRGTGADYRERYAPLYGRLMYRTAPTPGNHEWPNRRLGYDRYWSRAARGRPPAYYSFRLAGWQLLSLSSEAPHRPGSPQLRWLTGRVRAPGDCRLAFWHRPRFSAGIHGDEADIAPLWKRLRGRARIVVNGHDHNLQRLRPIDGIVELVSGAAGGPLYRLDRSDPRLAWGEDRFFGALRLELSPGLARYEFVALGGRVLDAGTIRCAS